MDRAYYNPQKIISLQNRHDASTLSSKFMFKYLLPESCPKVIPAKEKRKKTPMLINKLRRERRKTESDLKYLLSQFKLRKTFVRACAAAKSITKTTLHDAKQKLRVL